ncbi:hypothetical protein LWI29_012340 [Acer saccharum]|uniref:Uncharacterized protein n=1 Tax=Acer saccharum TaxID=4024 RepID=A0AA39TBJ2_ACESA|nr:hypothetical protein LWI29_012340 [Acer saccharum]
MATGFVQHQWKIPTSFMSSSFLGTGSFLQNHCRPSKNFKCYRERTPTGKIKRGNVVVCGWLLLVDPWAPNIDSASIAPQLFAASLFPYLGFLYFITKSKSAPNLTLFGFYFLLAFVGATIPAGIYAKVHYGTSLSNLFGELVMQNKASKKLFQGSKMRNPPFRLRSHSAGNCHHWVTFKHIDD